MTRKTAKRCLGLFAAAWLAGCNPSPNPPPMAVGPDTLNVADAAISGGDPNLALSITQSVLAADPGNPDALVHEGDAYYALGRCPAAVAAYQLALKADANSAAAETGLGRCLLKTDPAAAAAALTLAVRDDPGSAAAYNDLGIANDLQDQFAAAAAAYQRALVADPAMTAVEVNLGLSLALAGNGSEALQYLGPLASGQGATPKIREDYAAALVAAGREDEAKAVLAIDLSPDQVNSALAGFNALIAGDQTPLASAAAAMAAPPPPTQPTLRTGAVSSSALTPAPVSSPLSPPPRPISMATPAADPVALAVPATSPGAYAVQLAALNSEADAAHDWTRLSLARPALFDGRQPEIQDAKVAGRAYYRLRTAGFASAGAATRFCATVVATGCACVVADF